MKTRVGKLVVLAFVVLTIAVLTVRAQITNQLDFKVSQAFVAGNATLAAGSYVVRPVQGTDHMVIEISSASGKPSIMVEVESVQPDAVQGGSHVIFNKYKNILALSQIFPGAGNTGYQLLQGHPEKLAAKSETPTKQTVSSTAK